MGNIEENSNSLSAPVNFARCFNAQCLKAEKCLRHFAAVQYSNDSPYITTVNPTFVPADTNTCPYFKTTDKIHVAWGLRHLLEKIPYQDAISIRKQLVSHYGKSAYYRLYRGEHYLSSEDQAYIHLLFREKGITTEPTFEHYTDEYEW